MDSTQAAMWYSHRNSMQRKSTQGSILAESSNHPSWSLFERCDREIVILTSDFKVGKLLKASYAIWPGNGVHGPILHPGSKNDCDTAAEHLCVSLSLSFSRCLRPSVCLYACVCLFLCLSLSTCHGTMSAQKLMSRRVDRHDQHAHAPPPLSRCIESRDRVQRRHVTRAAQ